jgi:hypothetical protein
MNYMLIIIIAIAIFTGILYDKVNDLENRIDELENPSDDIE